MQVTRRALPPRRLRRWLAFGTVLAALVAVELTGVADGAPAHDTRSVGALNVVRQGAAGVYLRGWAWDGRTTAPTRVKIRIDAVPAAGLLGNLPRADVVAAHPGYPAATGFYYAGPMTNGTHTICAYAVDQPSLNRTLLGCRTVTFAFDPFGAIATTTQQPGRLTLTGWTIDPDVPTSARPVVVRVDRVPVVRVTADQPFAGLAARYPSAGDNHGYSASFPITEGTHWICVKAINIGLGGDQIIGCETRTVSFSPAGAVSGIGQVPGGFRVTGWASDPDTTATTTVTVTADGKPLGTVPADQAGGSRPGYGFTAQYLFPGRKLAPGNHTICAIAKNLGQYGEDRTVGCATQYFNWNPTAGVDQVVQHSPGATVTGWAVDPDTTAPIDVAVYADGKYVTTAKAGAATGSHPGHGFSVTVPLPNGTHTVCAAGVNTLYGSGDSAQACGRVTLDFNPYGAFESVGRAKSSTAVVATGWAIDPDTSDPIPVQVSIDGAAPVEGKANVNRPDVAKAHPGTGTAHGYAVTAPADDAEHKVCVRAVNVLGGSGTTDLGCKIINAVHPVAPAAPTAVGAIAGYGGAQITWAAPTSDGGAPWTGYTITAQPGGVSMTVDPTVQAATLLGLKPSTQYTFSVVATPVAGPSVAGRSPAVTTQKEPPAQTSPAPISTSRYIRNITGSSSADLATLRSEGASDAKANPSGHGYLIVLAVGGQDESRQGVVLSATIRFISYSDIVKNLNAYVDGYASQQRPSAPITLAIATNNDIDVSRGSGANFARRVVNPVQSYAARYPGITIAGSDDMEPGFRADYNATQSWLGGYLTATNAPFVFTGSADGCSWTLPDQGCNNGWTMRGLYHVAGGAAPIRIINLPQVYNTTMAQQWRYISLTGVRMQQPRINFGGALTEWTACQQERSCGSLTANTAWRTMWSQLNAEPQLKPSTLPYSTDLRVDS